ncbi:hypothetical protein B0H17DRAFT_1206600 [Mycena rosella]|uniref:Uncharacterized protein n=1 Tax=Mycena rosella TaxID=1033263 RepID=A0AAD7D4J4_MYCRO|nr:hypothetical protein B0H17DRAFT_1206600 [Mycena rosella]
MPRGTAAARLRDPEANARVNPPSATATSGWDPKYLATYPWHSEILYTNCTRWTSYRCHGGDPASPAGISVTARPKVAILFPPTALIASRYREHFASFVPTCAASSASLSLSQLSRRTHIPSLRVFGILAAGARGCRAGVDENLKLAAGICCRRQPRPGPRRRDGDGKGGELELVLRGVFGRDCRQLEAQTYETVYGFPIHLALRSLTPKSDAHSLRGRGVG